MKRGIVTVLLLVLLMPVCSAQSDDLWEEFGTDELERAGAQYGLRAELSEGVELGDGLQSLVGSAAEQLPAFLRSGLKEALAILAVVVLCAVVRGMQEAGLKQGGPDVSVMAGALAIAALAAGDMSAMLGLGRSTIDRMQGFSQVLLPVVAACTAATGSAAGAAARQVATAFFSNALITVIDRVLIPLVYAYVLACTAYAAVGNQGLKKIAQMLKWVVSRSLATLLILFVAYLTVTGTVAGTVDAAAVKAAKAAISTVIPVVGGIISNAAETILAGAGIVKNTVGIFGLLVVLAICLVPFLQLGVQYLIYKLCGALTAVLTDGRLAELVDGIGTAFALVLGMTGASALLLLISIVSGISGGGG